MSTRFQRPKIETDAERLAFLIEARTVLDQQIREVRARMSGKRSRRSSKIAPECGTESGYQRHRYVGEEADDACKIAHAEHNREAS